MRRQFHGLKKVLAQIGHDLWQKSFVLNRIRIINQGSQQILVLLRIRLVHKKDFLKKRLNFFKRALSGCCARDLSHLFDKIETIFKIHIDKSN